MREKMVSAVEEAAQTVGCVDYDDGMKSVKKLLEFVNSSISFVETVDSLRTTLESLPPLSHKQEEMALQGLRQLPQLLRYGIKQLSDTAASNLPAAGSGRPRVVDTERAQRALDWVSNLHRGGCKLSVAKERTARKYGMSRRSIERLWSKREETLISKLSMQDLVGMFSRGEFPPSTIEK